MQNQQERYDLVIFGAGAVGIAMAYEARKGNKKCLVIEKSKIKDNADRYWSSNFSARQNRVQYSEQYLSQFVVESNKYWDQIDNERRLANQQGGPLRLVEGSVWFGSTEISSSQGNIFAGNKVLQSLGVDQLYMNSLDQQQPSFFRNFNINDYAIQQKWGGLYQPDGGSINMELAYDYFYQYSTSQNGANTPVLIRDEINVDKIQHTKTIYETYYEVSYYDNAGKSNKVRTEKIFIATGIETPYFIKDKLNANDQLYKEAEIQEYIASYFEIQEGKIDQFRADNQYFTTWIQFLNEEYNTGYGFPFHKWDQAPGKTNTIKLGTMAQQTLNKGHPEELKFPKNQPPINPNDSRVLAAEAYVKKYMKNLQPKSTYNAACPIVFYQGRETILGYYKRQNKDIVVQTGGWVGKYFPLLALTAFKLLFDPAPIFNSNKDKKEQEQLYVMKQFLNRTAYPIRQEILKNLIDDQSPTVFQFENVVVGAGVSGLYSAYRLNTSKKPQNGSVAVFDMLDRIAGRLWSIKFKDTTEAMELGGMRYIEAEHKILTHYIKQLQIPELDFKMSGNFLQDYSLQAYLRNDRYRMNEWTDLQKQGQKLYTVYRISDQLIGMNALQIISFSAFLILTADYNQEARQYLNNQHWQEERRNNPDAPRTDYFSTRVYINRENNWTNYVVSLSLKDWNLIRNRLKYRWNQHNNSLDDIQPLFFFGFQNVIEDQFSHETYNFVAEQNGYYSATSNVSYLDQVVTYLLDFGSVIYKTLAGGFDMICYTLALELLNKDKGIAANQNGGGIFLKHQLTSIESLENKPYKYRLTFLQNGTNQVFIKTNNIILAMPRRSLELISNKIPFLQKDIDTYGKVTQCDKKDGIEPHTEGLVPKTFHDLISTTQNMPAVKIIMNFKKNWWDVSHVMPEYKSVEQMRGRSVTDLPIRQTLYFGTNIDNLLLSSYNDMVTTEFWSVLQKNFPRKFKHQERTRRDINHSTAMVHEEDYNVAPASVALVKEVVRQLSLVHGKKVKFQDVKEAMYQNWGNDPFGAGYHKFFSGYRVDLVMKCIRKPWEKERIFIVGESYSNLTGWVEGALQTTERMLNEHFDIDYTLPLDSYYPGY